MTEINDVRNRNIRELREMAGLQQVELAKLIGITQAYLSELESGKKSLTAEVVEKIAKVFDWLVTPEDENKEGLAQYIGIQDRDVEEPIITPEMILISHTASFYPLKVQDRIRSLMFQKVLIDTELHYILDQGDMPREEFIADLDREYERTRPPGGIILEKWATVQKKIEGFRSAIADKKHRLITSGSAFKDKQKIKITATKVPTFKPGKHKGVSNE